MDNQQGKRTVVKKIGMVLAMLCALGAVVLAAWYRIDGIPADSSAAFLTGDGFTTEQAEDGGLVFRPERSNDRGIVIMHGALILPQSYAKTAAYFAGRGYTVYLPVGAARLSINAVATAADIIRESDLPTWFLIGHSMGGMASLEVVARDDTKITAAALWAAAMPSDYSATDIPLLYLWGDTDGLLPQERFKDARENLPDDVEYVTVAGANHKNFALYTHQFFDRDATLDWMTQIDSANELTERFFDRY